MRRYLFILCVGLKIITNKEIAKKNKYKIIKKFSKFLTILTKYFKHQTNQFYCHFYPQSPLSSLSLNTYLANYILFLINF